MTKLTNAQILEGHGAAYREGASRTIEISEAPYMGLGRDSAGQWPLLRVTRDRATGETHVFLNGRPVANPSHDMLAMANASGTLFTPAGRLAG